MKKFLYFFGILALIAGLVSSCSKDEENENENELSIPQKRIAKVVEFPGDSDESIYVYEYDDKGRCISTARTYDGKSTTYSCTYEGNTMTEEWTYNGKPFSCIYTFDSNDNLISKKYEDLDGSDNYTYKYDNKGHLISETRTNDYRTRALTFEWEVGNISKITEYYKSDDYESADSIIFKYTNSEHPTPVKNTAKLSVMQSNYFDLDPIYSNLGIAPKNLPVHAVEYYTASDFDDETNTYIDTTETEEYDFKWILDGDQYPIKMIYKDEDSEFTYFDISWE